MAALLLIGLALGGNSSALIQPFIVWEKPFFATSVSQRPNAIYAAGGNQVRRYEMNGMIVWSVSVDSFVTGLFADPDGVLVVGSAFNSAYNGTGFDQRNATIARLDTRGELLWSRQLTTSTDSFTSSTASSLTVDSSGIYIAGYALAFGRYPLYGWVAKTDSNGTQLWVQRLVQVAITTGISAGPRLLYLSGHSRGCLGTSSFDVCPIQALVMAVDPAGQIVWTSEIPSSCGPSSRSPSCVLQGAPETLANGISVDATGVYVSGSTQGVIPGQVATSFQGGTDAFVGRYTLNGTELWLRQFGTAFQTDGYEISASPKGPFVLATDGLRQFDLDGNQTLLFQPDFATRSMSTTPRSIILGGFTEIAQVCAMQSCAHS